LWDIYHFLVCVLEGLDSSSSLKSSFETTVLGRRKRYTDESGVRVSFIV